MSYDLGVLDLKGGEKKRRKMWNVVGGMAAGGANSVCIQPPVCFGGHFFDAFKERCRNGSYFEPSRDRDDDLGPRLQGRGRAGGGPPGGGGHAGRPPEGEEELPAWRPPR